MATIGMALLLLIAAVWQWNSPKAQPLPAQPAPVENELARYQAPVYEPVTFNGSQAKAQPLFDAAMKAYQAADYITALAELNKTLELDNSITEAHFYDGACHFLLGHSNDAIAQMELVQMDVASPLQEQARWASAKAWLKKGDIAKARQLLEALIKTNGKLSGQSQTLLAALPSS